MDIDETLRLLRLTIAQMGVEVPGCAEWVAHAREVTEYFEAIDEWLGKGGYLPQAWWDGRRSL